MVTNAALIHSGDCETGEAIEDGQFSSTPNKSSALRYQNWKIVRPYSDDSGQGTKDIVTRRLSPVSRVEHSALHTAEIEMLSGGSIEPNPSRLSAFARTKELTCWPDYVRATGNLRLHMALRSQSSNGRES